MNENKMLKAALVGLVLLIFLGMGASSLQQSAWSQGYMMGLLSGGGESAAQLAPYAMYGHGFHGGFSIIGSFFRFIMFLFLIAIGFKFLRFWSWRMGMAGGPGGPGGHRGGDWHRYWHHDGPWCGPRSTASESGAEEKSEASASETDEQADPKPKADTNGEGSGNGEAAAK